MQVKDTSSTCSAPQLGQDWVVFDVFFLTFHELQLCLQELHGQATQDIGNVKQTWEIPLTARARKDKCGPILFFFLVAHQVWINTTLGLEASPWEAMYCRPSIRKERQENKNRKGINLALECGLQTSLWKTMHSRPSIYLEEDECVLDLGGLGKEIKAMLNFI